jgi:polyisoprenoid-binding protein YceI
MHYVAEPAQSRLTVQAIAAGMLSSLGHSPTFAVRDFTAELHFNPQAPGDATLRLTIRTDSLALADSASAKDRAEIEGRMRGEVLETASFPEVVYHASVAKADTIAEEWYRLELAGDLRLHGARKPHRMEAQLRLSEVEAHLSGRCPLSQSAYRIRPVTALGGLIKVKDELKFNFDIVFKKQDA